MIDQNAARILAANRYAAEMISSPDFPHAGEYVITGPQRGNLNGELGWHLYIGCVVASSGPTRHASDGWVELKHPDGAIRRYSGQFFYRASGALAERIRALFVDEPTPLRPKKPQDFTTEVLKFFADNDIREYLFWTQDLRFFVLCNDLFHWGSSDMEPLTKENLPELVRACQEAGDDGPLLFCARRRGMRPQAAMYQHLDEKNWPLFDTAGPDRKKTVQDVPS